MAQSKNNVKFCIWNVNCLISKDNNKLEDPNFVKQLIGNDIICLVETHLDKNTITSFDGFSIYRKDRPKVKRAKRSHGGILIMINNVIKNGVKHVCCKNENFHWIKLDKSFFSLKNDLYVCITHIPPQNSSYTLRNGDNTLEEIFNDVSKYSELGDVILCGDLNARTGMKYDFIADDDLKHFDQIANYQPDLQHVKRGNQDKCISSRGNQLIDFCIASNLRILNGRSPGDCTGKFTCHNALGSSSVDYVIANDILLNDIFYFHVHDHDATLSDHCKLSFSLKAKVPSNKANSRVIGMSNMKNRFHWNSDSSIRYHCALSAKSVQDKVSKLCCDLDSLHPDNCAEQLQDIFISAAKQSLRPKITQCKKKKRTQKPWYDQDLRKLRQRVQAGSKLLARDPRNPVTRSLLYRDLKYYNKQKRRKRKQFQQNILQQLEDLEQNDPKQFWALLDKLKDPNIKKQLSPNITHTQWYDHFRNLNSDPNADNYNVDLQNLESQHIFNELCYSISETEILQAVKSLKNGKSAGLDGITNEMIKVAVPILIKLIQKIFNKIFTSASYPQCWANGFITPIYKTNDPDSAANYRGLTINSCIGKLFNAVLNTRLDSYLAKHNIIHETQIGFKKKARTADHIFVMKTLISNYLENGKSLFTCFIDFKQAFDRVSRSYLLYRLLHVGIGGYFYSILKSMFDKTLLAVKIDNKVSPFFKSEIGVRQGDPLSPNLFKIFINEIPQVLQNASSPVKLGSTFLNCLLYADDIVILSESESGLQESINILQAHCEKIGMVINTNKSKVMIFNKSGKLLKHSFKLGNDKLETVKEYKYLGILLTPSGSFTSAKEQLYKKSLKAYFKLRKALEGLNNPHLGLHLFNHTVTPILTYGSEVWGIFNSSTTNIENMTFNAIYSQSKIEYTQKKFARSLLGVSKQTQTEALLGELGWKPVYSNVILSVIMYWHHIENSPENLLLTEALHVHKDLKTKEKANLVDTVQLMFRKMNILTSLQSLKDFTSGQLSSIIKRSLDDTIQAEWKEKLSKSPGKLKSYSKFKTVFKMEPYLSAIKNKAHRMSLSQLRCSSHKLNIETGRYKNINHNDRICSLCTANMIEDEEHFLCNCSFYETERAQLFSTTKNLYPNLSVLPTSMLFLWLMTCEDGIICTEVAKYTYTCFQKRKNAIA